LLLLSAAKELILLLFAPVISCQITDPPAPPLCNPAWRSL